MPLSALYELQTVRAMAEHLATQESPERRRVGEPTSGRADERTSRPCDLVQISHRGGRHSRGGTGSFSGLSESSTASTAFCQDLEVHRCDAACRTGSWDSELAMLPAGHRPQGLGVLCLPALRLGLALRSLTSLTCAKCAKCASREAWISGCVIWPAMLPLSLASHAAPAQFRGALGSPDAGCQAANSGASAFSCLVPEA